MAGWTGALAGVDVNAKPSQAFWNGRRVLVTGHTGFKGSWLTVWLSWLGARVTGIALPPGTTPNLYNQAGVATLCESLFCDIRDAHALRNLVHQSRPEIVFHLAAQPLVRAGYREPLDTFATNVMGTAHILEALRGLDSVRAAVMITTDKVYANQEWVWPYRETEALGGRDPYSASKAASELAIEAYKFSFLQTQGVAVASARAGNVIGGGDWAQDRLLPDFLRALDAGETLHIRSPHAVRPWQHVLEPLAGYLLLGEKLVATGATYAEAWNFGPDEADTKPVSWILERFCTQMPHASWVCENTPQFHEAGTLKLDSSKAKTRLNWYPRWPLETALDKTLEWHLAWKNGANMYQVTRQQLEAYLTA